MFSSRFRWLKNLLVSMIAAAIVLMEHDPVFGAGLVAAALSAVK